MKNSKRFFEFFLYLIFIIFLIEGITRLFFKITNKDIDVYRNFSFERLPKILTPDSVLDYKLIPNVSRNALTSDFQIIYKTNSFGLREKEIVETDKFKILFLGDSMTYGEGIPYGSRFSDLIEKEIANVYTINAGVLGYGIHQMYKWLKYYGMKLKPDLVICSIIPTDLDRSIYKKIENSPYIVTLKEEKRHKENQFNYLVKSFKNSSNRLLGKSYFYSVLKVNLQIKRMLLHIKERDKKVWDEIRKKGDGGHYKITTDEQREMVKEESTRIFLDFKDLCDRDGAKFLVVNINTRPISWLSNFFAGHHIEYLDLSYELNKIPQIRFEIDPHYNTKGNRAIANFLREYILNRYKDEIRNHQNRNKV